MLQFLLFSGIFTRRAVNVPKVVFYQPLHLAVRKQIIILVGRETLQYPAKDEKSKY